MIKRDAMFSKTILKKKLSELLDNNPVMRYEEILRIVRTEMVSKDDYIRYRPVINEIVSWYVTMQQEREIARQWYHTIDLGDGQVTNGIYDHRALLRHYKFPEVLSGKSVLDVGPADGFFAFEFEKRDAKEVIAIDAYENPHFIEAQEKLKSNVVYKIMDVYDLNPVESGYFDMIFCGTVLIHLSDPFRALSAMRNVMKKRGILYIATVYTKLQWYFYPIQRILKQPFASLVRGRQSLGQVASYWVPSIYCLKEMLFKVGFNDIEQIATFDLPENYNLTKRKVSYPHVVLKAA